LIFLVHTVVLLTTLTVFVFNTACLFNSHCGLNEECIDMLRLSSLVAEKFNSSSELQRLNSKARITGKECSKATPAFLKNIDIEEILKLLEKDIERINKIMDENDLRSVGVDLRQISGTFDINVRQTLGAPMTRQFGLTGSSTYCSFHYNNVKKKHSTELQRNTGRKCKRKSNS